jgi:DUF4097 and DUF4098 domain-containing protein YvlB
MLANILLVTMLILSCGAPRAELTTESGQRRDFNERDEFNQTYQLPPGARVEVSSIRGRVEIATADTTTAEVQIIRTARTRADLEYHKIEVAQMASGLVVRGLQEPEDRRRDNIQVNHEVILRLPRHIDLSVNSISGPIRVGDVDGQIHVSSISGSARFGNVGGPMELNSISGSANIGNVSGRLEVSSISGSLDVGTVNAQARVNSISGNLRLGKVNDSLNVSGVSGSVTAALDNLSLQGIRINSVSGSVTIAFSSDVNADFTANSVSGEVYFDVPNVIRDSEEKSSNVRARIGAGGTPITISSVSGNIRLKRS